MVKNTSEKPQILRLNRQQEVWETVNLQPAWSDPDEPPVLLGADGNSLGIWDTVNNKVIFYDPAP